LGDLVRVLSDNTGLIDKEKNARLCPVLPENARFLPSFCPVTCPEIGLHVG
jgi:hypothetical protein